MMNGLVPLQADLTKEDLRFNVLRGHETMYRVDVKFGPGVELETGEWAVIGADGHLARPSATPSNVCYPVFCGTERSDVHATGKCTVLKNSLVTVKTNKFAANGSYAVGTELTVKDLGAGEAFVSPAANGEFVLAVVTEVGSGYIVYDVVPAHKKA